MGKIFNQQLFVSGGEGGLPIDPNSQTPIVFGIDENGFYMSDTATDETPFYIGRDANGLYVTDGGNE